MIRPLLYPVLNLTVIHPVLMFDLGTHSTTGHLHIVITFTDDSGILASTRGGSTQHTEWDEQVAENDTFFKINIVH